MIDITINHVSLIISDCNKTADFYYRVFGLHAIDERPDLGFPGLWYQLGKQQIHMLQVDNPYSSAPLPVHGGRDRHLALNVTNIEKIKISLQQMNIDYTSSKSGRKAIFFRDPDKNVLEVCEIQAGR